MRKLLGRISRHLDSQARRLALADEIRWICDSTSTEADLASGVIEALRKFGWVAGEMKL